MFDATTYNPYRFDNGHTTYILTSRWLDLGHSTSASRTVFELHRIHIDFGIERKVLVWEGRNRARTEEYLTDYIFDGDAQKAVDTVAKNAPKNAVQPVASPRKRFTGLPVRPLVAPPRRSVATAAV
jgi:hypothetical protein